MKNVVGAPAVGENLFYRASEINKIVERIDNGNNLQIAAPRRVGKTSILQFLRDSGTGGHLYVYVDTEAIESEHEFYKKLLKTLLKTEPIISSKKLHSLLNHGKGFFSKIKSIKVMGNAIDFNEEADHNYKEELSNLLSGLQLDDERKLVLMIDEFPQTVLNIVSANKGDTREAIQFLQSNRELRQNPDIMGKVQFIYTGSVGLNHTVASISATAFVNDLNSIQVDPLTEDESKELINQLLENKQLQMSAESVAYLLEKIAWLIPFHIQLCVQEIAEQCRKAKTADVAPSIVDASFKQMVESRNNNHFEHYSSRLKAQFKDKEFQYAENILNQMAENGAVATTELFDKSVGFGVQESYRKIIEILTYDGYINNVADAKAYQFNSPIVRLWWQKFICK
jgi:uncharacterized protein